jgi:xanthosine utilization system XapX-like protein
MDEKTKKICLNMGSGVLVGIMFNVALNASPVNPEGLLGGVIVGLLMYML